MTHTQAPEDPYGAAELPAWRRRLPFVVAVAVLVASALVLATTPQVSSSQAAMGQGLPSTSLGTVAVDVLAVGFLPDGFAMVSEDADGSGRVTQRFEHGGSAQVILVTTVAGEFDADAALAADPAAEAVDVGGRSGVLQRVANAAVGQPNVVVQVGVGDGSVIVRGVGGVSADTVVAVAASVSTQAS